MKRTAAALLLLATTAAAAPPAGAGGMCVTPGVPSAEEVTTTVSAVHACWAPSAVVVAPGATVTFRNDDDAEHNVSGPGIVPFELPRGTHRVTFERPGLYPFQCTFHPGMAGVVVVRDLGAPPAAAQQVAGPSAPAGDGRGSLAWAAAGIAVLLGGFAAFGRRARRVPQPAR